MCAEKTEYGTENGQKTASTLARRLAADSRDRHPRPGRKSISTHARNPDKPLEAGPGPSSPSSGELRASRARGRLPPPPTSAQDGGGEGGPRTGRAGRARLPPSGLRAQHPDSSQRRPRARDRRRSRCLQTWTGARPRPRVPERPPSLRSRERRIYLTTQVRGISASVPSLDGFLLGFSRGTRGGHVTDRTWDSEQAGTGKRHPSITKNMVSGNPVGRAEWLLEASMTSLFIPEKDHIFFLLSTLQTHRPRATPSIYHTSHTNERTSHTQEEEGLSISQGLLCIYTPVSAPSDLREKLNEQVSQNQWFGEVNGRTVASW
ncbi:uncharacterized protein [Callorhinus ursinus]|uniref:uncharacterized protein n=1 Tax=Callorhinus ursinus TaxID=34884 RepID=UPI003CD007F1